MMQDIYQRVTAPLKNTCNLIYNRVVIKNTCYILYGQKQFMSPHHFCPTVLHCNSKALTLMTKLMSELGILLATQTYGTPSDP